MHAALNDTEQRRRVVAMGFFRTLGPTQGQFHGNTRDIFIRRVRRAFVENHHNVGAQVTLDLHRLFRPHEHLGAVDRRSEGHALLLDLAHRAQAEHLETAGVGQNRAFPLHEIVQVAVLLDHFRARAQPQVEGVAQNDFSASRLDIPWQHALDRAVGAHRHESRGLDGTAREGQTTATSLAISGQQLERHTTGATHTVSSGPDSLGAVGAGLRVMNIASP
ncbi:hypothetical protein D3C80_420350 [compost metagenome]